MKLTDETWNQIIDEESQTIGIEAPYIRRVSRRSIERVLGSIPEQGLTDKDLATLEAIKNRADREYPASIGNQGAWLWVMSAVSGILSSHPAPAPEPTKQKRVTVVGAVVYLDGKEFAVFKGHDSNCPAEKYAAGLRQELEETK
jgi:hypothetical protein